MDPNAMKNMIILKDLPSNMIEEAFVIFKDNVKIHTIDRGENNKKGVKVEKVKPKDYIVKEAEMVISDYICKIEKKENELGAVSKRLKEKYKRLKILTLFLGMFSALSMIVILLK